MAELLGLAVACLEIANSANELYKSVQKFVHARPQIKALCREIERSSTLLINLHELFKEDPNESPLEHRVAHDAQVRFLDDYREIFDELQDVVMKALKHKTKGDATKTISRWDIPRYLLKESEIEEHMKRLDRCKNDVYAMLVALAMYRLKDYR